MLCRFSEGFSVDLILSCSDPELVRNFLRLNEPYLRILFNQYTVEKLLLLFRHLLQLRHIEQVNKLLNQLRMYVPILLKVIVGTNWSKPQIQPV